MPWVWVLILVASVYLIVKIVQSVTDFVAWWNEPRIDPKGYKRAKRDAGRVGGGVGREPGVQAGNFRGTRDLGKLDKQ